MEKPEYLALLKTRENLYRFLRRLYISEVDEALLYCLKRMRFPAQGTDVELSDAYKLMEHSLDDADGDAITDLAVDYARIFLGAGIASLEVAYPYESVYTGKKLIMQEARDEVIAIYGDRGLQKSESVDFPEDHIALELEFLAFLCGEARQAVETGERAIGACFEEQICFLRRILNWVPMFCDDVEKYAETKFYKALAKITRAYLRMDKALLEGFVMKTN